MFNASKSFSYKELKVTHAFHTVSIIMPANLWKSKYLYMYNDLSIILIDMHMFK